jgi:hypothetical protein
LDEALTLISSLSIAALSPMRCTVALEVIERLRHNAILKMLRMAVFFGLKYNV